MVHDITADPSRLCSIIKHTSTKSSTYSNELLVLLLKLRDQADVSVHRGTTEIHFFLMSDTEY